MAYSTTTPHKHHANLHAEAEHVTSDYYSTIVAVLCSIVQGCAMLCCAMLCYAVLCCAMLCCLSPNKRSTASIGCMNIKTHPQGLNLSGSITDTAE